MPATSNVDKKPPTNQGGKYWKNDEEELKKIRSNKSYPWNKDSYPYHKRVGWNVYEFVGWVGDRILYVLTPGQNSTIHPWGYYKDGHREFEYINKKINRNLKMKRSAIVIIISSMLMVFYLSYVSIQINENLVNASRIGEIVNFQSIGNTDLSYYLESIVNSNESIKVNIYLLFFFILINFIFAIFIIFRARKL